MTSPWNHGKISRHAAEELLVANGNDGAFLVRESESVAGAHVLSLWFEGMVHHFRILKKMAKFTVQNSCGTTPRLFSSLEELIELFKQPGQGLPHHLKEAIVTESNNDLDHDSDDDEQEQQENDDVDSVDVACETTDILDIGSMFMTKLSEMDSSGLGDNFCNSLRNYLAAGIERDRAKMSASKLPTDLHQLIVASAEDVRRELKKFLERIMFLQKLFCTDDDTGKLVVLGSSSPGSGGRQTNDVSSYDELVNDLAICVAGIKSLQTLVLKAHQEQASLMKDQQSQTRTFEVTSCGNFKTRSYLKVDITEGNLWFMRNENDTKEDCSVVDHDKILQLVKDPGSPKLTFKITAKSNREYMFKDVQTRENLCQLVQHMMNTHDPSKEEPKQISVFVGTWNMGSASPPQIESWLKCQGTGKTIDDEQFQAVVGHDMYAIGTQESSIGETAWISKIKMVLKKQFKVDYYTVASQSLWGIRLVILARPEHKNRISRVEKSSVKTGIANKLGNKGGVGISFDFLSTSLCFINSHLTSGNEDARKKRRKQNYADILKGLSLGHKSAYDLTNQFHHVFWFGDLNYRIDLLFDNIMKAITDSNYKTLACEDQLKKEQECGNAFVDFHECELDFPPTYRYKRGTHESYEHIKVKRSGNRTNVPSWCDRVLWRSFPGLPVIGKSYGCTKDIKTSDHSPVFASFEVPIISQFVASRDQGRKKSQTNGPSCKINVPYVKAKVNTVSKTNFYLELHSVCLAASQKSRTDKPCPRWDLPQNVDSKGTGSRYCEWKDCVPELNPILDDPEYLKEQHLLIAVKSEAGDESYGECVLSLKDHLSESLEKFEKDLFHGGVKTGEIQGKISIQYPKLAVASKRPTTFAKPDSVSKKPSSTAGHSRPVSCVTPSVSDNVPALSASKKSASLGRQPTFAGFTGGSTSSSGAVIKPYVTLSCRMLTSGKSIDIDERSESEALAPPPLPEKTRRLSALPTSVDQFLSKLGLSQYFRNFEDNGFEELMFLDNISDIDLVDIGITDSDHAKIILAEVELLQKTGFFNS